MLDIKDEKVELTSAIWLCRSSSQIRSWSSRRASFLSGWPPDLLGTWHSSYVLHYSKGKFKYRKEDSKLTPIPRTNIYFHPFQVGHDT